MGHNGWQTTATSTNICLISTLHSRWTTKREGPPKVSNVLSSRENVNQIWQSIHSSMFLYWSRNQKVLSYNELKSRPTIILFSENSSLAKESLFSYQSSIGIGHNGRFWDTLMASWVTWEGVQSKHPPKSMAKSIRRAVKPPVTTAI